jgi:hypothetical protein
VAGVCATREPRVAQAQTLEHPQLSAVLRLVRWGRVARRLLIPAATLVVEGELPRRARPLGHRARPGRVGAGARHARADACSRAGNRRPGWLGDQQADVTAVHVLLAGRVAPMLEVQLIGVPRDGDVLTDCFHGSAADAHTGLPGRFHPHFRDKNGCSIGESQSKWTACKMETPRSPAKGSSQTSAVPCQWRTWREHQEPDKSSPMR